MREVCFEYLPLINTFKRQLNVYNYLQSSIPENRGVNCAQNMINRVCSAKG